MSRRREWRITRIYVGVLITLIGVLIISGVVETVPVFHTIAYFIWDMLFYHGYPAH